MKFEEGKPYYYEGSLGNPFFKKEGGGNHKKINIEGGIA